MPCRHPAKTMAVTGAASAKAGRWEHVWPVGGTGRPVCGWSRENKGRGVAETREKE